MKIITGGKIITTNGRIWGDYWDIVPGQLKDKEDFHVGFHTYAAALKNKTADEEIRLLDTIEHNKPAPVDEKKKFRSKRYCLVYKKK